MITRNPKWFILVPLRHVCKMALINKQIKQKNKKITRVMHRSSLTNGAHTRLLCAYPPVVSEHRNQRPPRLESSFGTPPSITGNNPILAAVSFLNQFNHSSRYSHPHAPADASGASFEGGRLQIFFPISILNQFFESILVLPDCM